MAAHPALSPRRRPLVGASDLAGALPEWRTSLVGRSAEVAAIVDRLVAGHVVTLVGPAGVGKTRLAVAAASQAALPGQLLGAADDERRAVGAAAWPLEPYRDTALRTLESLSMGASDQAGMRK